MSPEIFKKHVKTKDYGSVLKKNIGNYLKLYENSIV